MSTFKAVFLILTFVGLMWFTTVGALVFAMDSFAVDTQRPTTVANGSIYMSAFFLALIINVAIIAPGLLLLQFSKLKRIIRNERSAVTPRQRFRGRKLMIIIYYYHTYHPLQRFIPISITQHMLCPVVFLLLSWLLHSLSFSHLSALLLCFYYF